MNSIILLTILLLILCFYPKYRPDTSPIYLNINMSDVCKKVDDSEIIPSQKNDINSINKKCENELFDIKQKYNKLKLIVDDPEPDDILYLMNSDSRYNIKGDDSLTSRMMNMGKKNKEAIINRAMWNKNSLLPYLEDELRMHSESIWYDNEDLERDF